MDIIELELQTRQPDKLKTFYTRTLGFKLASDLTDLFSLVAGTSKLNFKLNQDRAEGVYHFAFRVPYEQFEEVKEWLQQRVQVLPDPQLGAPVVVHQEWQAKALYFPDPEGNIVELIAHQSIKVPERSVYKNGVVSICEIGMAVPQVPVFANELKYTFGLDRWKTGNETFEAVGDAHGLFILAEEKRNWFPTVLPATALPVKVTVRAPHDASINKYGYSINEAVEKRDIGLK